ncbi:MAG: TRAM domain-containing protein, partial [Stellaceae bacterium]
DFAATLALIRAVGFAQAFSFKYSRRPGTPAAQLQEQIPEGVKSARLQRLQNALDAARLGFNQSCVGRVLPVLFEKPGRHAGQWVGRSPFLQGVHAAAPARCRGTVVPVRITGAGLNSLSGEVAMAEARA